MTWLAAFGATWFALVILEDVGSQELAAAFAVLILFGVAIVPMGKGQPSLGQKALENFQSTFNIGKG